MSNEELNIELIKCVSGRYLAFYLERTDIIANGDNQYEAVENLKILYQSVIQYGTNAQNNLT